MKNLLNYVFLLVITLSIYACEEVPVDIPDYVEIESGKTVLIEELTGVSCSNCPAGEAAIRTIKNQYPDNVIIVGIHGELLSEPVDKEGYESKYDFRIPEARALESFFSPDAKPAVSFNRVPVAGSALSSIDREQWFSMAERELQKEQVIGIIINTGYNTETRKLDIDIEVDPLVDLQGDFHLSVMLLESHIVDSQKDVDKIFKDYEHNHVLRDMISAVKGDAIAQELTKDEEKTYSYSYTLPTDQGLWIPENVSVVAFVSDQQGNSEEVLQSSEKYIIE